MLRAVIEHMLRAVTAILGLCKAKDRLLLNSASINSPCLYSARQPKDYSSSDTELLLELPV